MAKSKIDPRATKDDVARLIRGKPSKGKVGSRQVRHRLRLDEIERLEIARSRGYLLITSTTRKALQNAWFLDCDARDTACVFAERVEDGFAVTQMKGEEFTREIVAIQEEIVSFLSGSSRSP